MNEASSKVDDQVSKEMLQKYVDLGGRQVRSQAALASNSTWDMRQDGIWLALTMELNIYSWQSHQTY